MQSKTIKRLGWKTPTSAGFTLVELIVSIFAFAILAMGVIALTSNVLTSADSQGRALANVDLARKTSFEIISGLRAAAYSDNGAYPLQEVSPLTLTFYTNFDGGSDVERVRYFIQNNALYRGVVKPSGNPPTYNLTQETVYLLIRDLASSNNIVFTYYDGSFQGEGLGNPLAAPIQITDVSYVQISLDIKKDKKSSSVGMYNVKAGASIRNLKTNLGD